MKKILSFAFVLALVFSCGTNDDNLQYYNVAKPVLVSKADLRASVEILGPQSIDESGKIYAYLDYVFINDKEYGVHVIDNSNPSSPHAVAFIKIPGNVDISIKDDYLYADSYTDLVVFDISDINNIVPVNTLEDVFYYYNYNIPAGVDIIDYVDFDPTQSILVGWNVVLERREPVADDIFVLESGMGANTLFDSNVGVGGSLARFQIVDDYLYTVGESDLHIFDISSLDSPIETDEMYAGWSIETMFYANDYLYLGSTNGMYIYDIANRLQPIYVSEFTHWELCDPVVVDGDYAYLTLRGGNDCGQMESVLEVIDVSDRYNPVLVGQYPMENPYGLGYKGTSLFVCDGIAGLKVYDITNPMELQLTENFEDVEGKDIIPLDNVLLLIGDGMLYQYEYIENSVSLLSTYQL